MREIHNIILALRLFIIAPLLINLSACSLPYKDELNSGERSIVDSCEITSTSMPDSRCDEDGDGVKNTDDQCPHSVANVYVDGNGCVYDSDHDGVSNPFDRCSDSPQDSSVDAEGCPRD